MSVESYVELAQQHLSLVDIESARRLINEGLEQFGYEPRLLQRSAEIELKAGRRDSARERFRLAKESYEQAGDLARAGELSERLAEVDEPGLVYRLDAIRLHRRRGSSVGVDRNQRALRQALMVGGRDTASFGRRVRGIALDIVDRANQSETLTLLGLVVEALVSMGRPGEASQVIEAVRPHLEARELAELERLLESTDQAATSVDLLRCSELEALRLLDKLVVDLERAPLANVDRLPDLLVVMNRLMSPDDVENRLTLLKQAVTRSAGRRVAITIDDRLVTLGASTPQRATLTDQSVIRETTVPAVTARQSIETLLNSEPGHFLRVDSGAASGRVIEFTARDFLIGREPDSDFIVRDDDAVSRRHARLSSTNSGVTLTDTNSSNGVHLNGHRLVPNTETAVPLGAPIQIGHVVFSVHARRPEPLLSDSDRNRLLAERELGRVLDALTTALLSFLEKNRDVVKRQLLDLGELGTSDRQLRNLLEGRAIPEIRQVAHWFDDRKGLSLSGLRNALQKYLGITKEIRSRLFALGDLRNVLAHRADYEFRGVEALGGADEYSRADPVPERPPRRVIVVPEDGLKLLKRDCDLVVQSFRGIGRAQR